MEYTSSRPDLRPHHLESTDDSQSEQDYPIESLSEKGRQFSTSRRHHGEKHVRTDVGCFEDAYARSER